MGTYYFLDSRNQQQGPFPANQLLKYGVKRDTQVWGAGGLLTTIILGNDTGSLMRGVGLDSIAGEGFLIIVIGPVMGIGIIILSRIFAEMIRIFAALANNTKEIATNVKNNKTNEK